MHSSGGNKSTTTTAATAAAQMTSAVTESHDPCKAFVAALRSRHEEEDASRRSRAQRRADVLNRNLQRCKRKDADLQRVVMETKLSMMSQVEHDLLHMLDEQSKWRHVMLENVVTRDKQMKAVQSAQLDGKSQLLQHVVGLANEAAAVTERDDTRRHREAQADIAAKHRASVVTACQSIVSDTVQLAWDVAQYSQSKRLDMMHPSTVAAFDSVPPLVFQAMKRDRWPSPNDAAELASRHVTLSLFNVPAIPGAAGSRSPPAPSSPTKPPSRPTSSNSVQPRSTGSSAPAFLQSPTAAPLTVNPVFCSLVSKVVQKKYPPRDTFQPVTATPKALILVVGPKLAGKTFSCTQLAAKYNLMLVSERSLAESAMDCLGRDLTADDLNDESLVDLLDLGREVRQRLTQGGDIPDELVARLVLNQWVSLPEQFDGLLVDGVPASQVLLTIIETRLSKFRASVEQAPQFSIAPTNVERLIGAPGLNDAIFMVEKVEKPTAPDAAASGIAAGVASTAAAGKDATAAGKKADVAAGGKGAAGGGKRDDKKGGKAGVPAKEEVEVEPLPPIDLPIVEPLPPLSAEEVAVVAAAQPTKDVSGIARVVCLSLPSIAAAFHRFAGLRVDPETHEEFHLTSNPPPLERIVATAPRDRVEADCVSMHTRIPQFNDQFEATASWFSKRFDDVLHVVRPQPGDLSETHEAIMDALEAEISSALTARRDRYENSLLAARILSDRKEMEALQQKRIAARDAVRKQLLQVYTDRCVDPIPQELLIDPFAVVVDPKEVKEYLPIPPSVPDSIIHVLDGFSRYHERFVVSTVEELVRLVSASYDNGCSVTAQLAQFWRQPDHKQGVVEKYVHELNAMTPALRRDVQGKEELHLRADVLLDQLHQATDKRREESSALIESLTNSAAFFDGWNDAVRYVGSTLVQLEVERFLIVRHVAQLYYCGIRGEVFQPDEADLCVDTLIVPKVVVADVLATGATAVNPAAAAAEAAKPGAKVDPKAKPAPPPKKGAAPAAPTRSAEEERAMNSEEPLAAAVEKAISVMKTIVDQAAAPIAPVAAAAPAKKEGGKKPTAAEAAAAAALEEAANKKPVVTTGMMVAQIIAPELDLCKRRMQYLSDVIRRVIEEGAHRNAVLRSKLLLRQRDKLYKEYEANASVVNYLRCRVEEEVPVEFALIVEHDTFRVDTGHRVTAAQSAGALVAGKSSQVRSPTSPATPKQQAAQFGDVSFASSTAGGASPSPNQVVSTLSFERAMDVIRLLKRVSPNYVIQLADFKRVVRDGDLAFGNGHALSVDEAFARFDIFKADAIDWREFIVHLLLWAEPLMGNIWPGHFDPNASGPFSDASASGRNPFYVDGPSLIQLYDVRDVLGTDYLDRDAFLSCDFFFESQMNDTRAQAYKELLWECFVQPYDPQRPAGTISPSAGSRSAVGSPQPVNPATASSQQQIFVVDPNALAMFLCADEQPLRGVQKAFAMSAEWGDETFSLSQNRLFGLFHFNAASKTALGLQDEYGRDELEVLFTPGGPEALSFQDVCSSLAGRVMLNACRLFARRKFSN